MPMGHSFNTCPGSLHVNLNIFTYSDRSCQMWFLRVGINSKAFMVNFEKCLNAEKSLPCYFYIGDLQLQMVWIQRAWINNFNTFLTKLELCNLVKWISLNWFLNLLTESSFN